MNSRSRTVPKMSGDLGRDQARTAVTNEGISMPQQAPRPYAPPQRTKFKGLAIAALVLRGAWSLVDRADASKQG